MGILRQTVALNGIRFFAYHGFYEEERKTGTTFLLDIETEFELKTAGNDEIQHTLNYERLFEIAEAEMGNTRKLLETVVYNIIERIKKEFGYVDYIKVRLQKMNPPFSAQINNSVVQLVYTR
ncbi:dihydroneopterin aldolase [Rubrolithibacter danxiaensis]|uniref:dihydroneopterin aldolase n=1 Tax=Rubrolithibacter danxiaensis TaxID=3390805 RepID=UPI003BF8C71E